MERQNSSQRQQPETPLRKKLANFFTGCFKPEVVDPSLLTHSTRALATHAFGDMSYAVLQGNAALEDRFYIDNGVGATFVGVFDGHAGHQCAVYVAQNLHPKLARLVDENIDGAEDVFKSAFAATDDEFLNIVQTEFEARPLIAAEGTCCLVGVIFGGTLYVANVGDSRAVIGSVDGSNNIAAVQINREDNVNINEVREELMNLHPDDGGIVYHTRGAWRVKGVIQVSRALGDAYMKRPEFSLDNLFMQFQLTTPLTRPVLSAEPTVYARVLRPEHKFVIFASDGLWNLMRSDKVVEAVHTNPRKGIAERLLKECLKDICRSKGLKYEDLKKMPVAERRAHHDDITIVVIFLDHHYVSEATTQPPVPQGDDIVPEAQPVPEGDDIVPEQPAITSELSFKVYNDNATLSKFSFDVQG